MDPTDTSQKAAIIAASFDCRKHVIPTPQGIDSALAELGRNATPFLFTNFKMAKLPLPKWLKEEDDLYCNSPKEIRQEHSLHIIGPEAGERWHELFKELRVLEAAIIVMAEKSREELLARLKLYLAWYAQPASLKVQLEQGSDNLRRGIMTDVKALLLQTTPKSDWVVYLPPGVSWPNA